MTPPAPLPLVVEIAGLRGILARAARLLVEAAVVPTALVALLAPRAGLVWGVGAALLWVYGTVGLRLARRDGAPGTLLLCAGMLTGRAATALATSSAVVYLVQPALGSVLMGAVFVGSAALGRPVTQRLARDFVPLPAHVLERTAVRRMFRDVALLWGLSRLLDAGMNLSLLHLGLQAGMVARGVLSPVLTAVAVAACAAWGLRALRRDGVQVRLVPAAAVATA